MYESASLADARRKSVVYAYIHLTANRIISIYADAATLQRARNYRDSPALTNQDDSMKTQQKRIVTALLAALLITGTAKAAVSEEEAARLGNELTGIGAERAGNGNGIPEYTGGLRTPPENYRDDQRYVNPFPEDRELYRIDRSNVDEHKDRLSPGQIAMIRRFDSFFIPVYETRRTAAYPDSWVEQSKRNATRVELESSGNGILNYESGVPFPIPQSGVEVIFNHTSRYRGGSLTRNIAQAVPQPNGNFTAVRLTEDITYPTALTDYRPDAHDNILFYFRQTVTSPARLAGNELLVHEKINQVAEGRNVWVYNSAQRRVRRAPDVAYDGPGTAADGQRTADNLDMFNGAPDRYNWELVGKKEMYIPYNSYKLTSTDLRYEDILKPGHIDQSLTRYELHRVWHVRATVKDDVRHLSGQRDFYVDEDSWQIAAVDHYDGRGNLWRVAEAHKLQSYDVDIPFYAFESLYDLVSGRYIVIGLTNEEVEPYRYNTRRQSSFYTPSALRSTGR